MALTPHGFLSAPNALDLYRNADKFLLEQLRTQCYDYLKLTTNISNVTDRLFHYQTQYDRPLPELFLEYIVVNYNEVKITQS